MNDIFAGIYEFLFYEPSFSGNMFTFGMYSPIGLSMIISSFIIMLLFYYIINSPRFNKRWHWLIMLVVNFILNFCIAYFWSKMELELQGFQYASEYFSFGLWNAVLSILVFIFFSIIPIIKIGSRWCFNTRTTPIKQ